MVDGDRQFIPLTGFLSLLPHDESGIVDQDVESVVLLAKRIRRCAHLIQRSKISKQHVQIAVTRPAFDIRPDLLRLFWVSGMQHHPYSLPGQLKGGDIPDAGSGPGNQCSAFRCSVFRHG